MKVYVLRYGPTAKQETGERQKSPSDRLENTEVEYSREPVWRMPSLRLAKGERDLLCEMQVHVGPHYCEFSVEELPEGDFALVCLSHPDGEPETQ